MPVVIIGAGIIGLSTAYHLLELGCSEPIHLIEASELFSGASGYAGGFLAADWYSHSVLPLGRLSFSLHRQLAEKNNGRKLWGYAPSTGVSLGGEYDEDDKANGADWLLQGTSRAQVAERHAYTRESGNETPNWLRVGKNQNVDVISGGDSTAQVDPLRLCQFLLQSCQSRGVLLHQACTVTKLKTDSATRRLQSVELSNGNSVPCSKLILTAGPWTSQVFQDLFPASSNSYKKLSVGSLAGHSIVVRSPHWKTENTDINRTENELGCHAVFATSFSASDKIMGDRSFAPEVFSRHPNEIYLAGLNSSSAQLPQRAHESSIDESAIEALKAAARKMLNLEGEQKDDIEVVRQGLCFRPTTNTGRPYIAQLPSKALSADCTFEEGDGVWVSAGHGPWGISLSQGTGLVLAEMVLGKKPSINTAPYSL